MSRGRAGTAAAISALGAAVILAIPASAGLEVEITVEAGGEDRFAPERATVNLDQAIFRWAWEDPPTDDEHNVRQDRRLFYSGPPEDGTAGDFVVRASAGSFHYYCEPHGTEVAGMEGKLRVRPEMEPISGDKFRVRWSSEDAVVGDRYDVRFRVDDGRWRDWKRNTAKLAARFGRKDNPVDVGIGHTYRFKARTQKGPKDRKASDFSPKLRVELGA